MAQLAECENFNANSDMSELLNTELNIDGRYHPNLGGISRGGMANHYPMTILSMHELGASDEQLRSFKHQWPRHRALIDETLGLIDKRKITDKNWHLVLGQSQKLKEFRRVFLEQFFERNTADVITDALDHMRDGLPMGLFHPLIRLSFAAIHGDKGLLADALAYMAIRYHDIYKAEAIQNMTTVEYAVFRNAVVKQAKPSDITSGLALQNWSMIRALNQNNQLSGRLPSLTYGGSIHVCEQLCSSPFVHELSLNSGFNINQGKLQNRIAQICKAAAQLYLSEPSLSTLHAVTASHALADLTLRFVKSDQSGAVFTRLWRHYWVWLTSLFIEKGCTLSSIEPSDASQERVSERVSKRDWPQLSVTALRTNEVHVIKMVYSCKWLFENFDADPLYQQAAEATL
ncbi:MAG: hypothetical protein ACI93R_003428 [Flavobacteriales bacterium]|jgi:hypothetical protein